MPMAPVIILTIDRVGRQESGMNIIAKLRNGNQHHQAGRLVEAKAIYDAVLHQYPNHPDALHLSGLLAFQQGNHIVSIRRIERAVEQNPSHIGYLKNLCAILVKTGAVDKAAGHVERALEHCPDSVDLWLTIGNLRQRLGIPDTAVAAYREVLARVPDHAEAQHNMGTALFDMAAYTEAVGAFQRAVALDPAFPEALYHLGNALREIGDLEKAIDALKQALSLAPDHADAQFNLAKMYRETGQTEAAIDAYTASLKMNPGCARTYNNLGNLFYDLGQTQAARDLYTQALSLDPDYPQAHVNLGLALQEMGDLEGAMAHSKRALELCPDCADAVSNLVHQKRQACDWEGLEHLDRQLDELTRRSLSQGVRPAEGPFLNLSRRDDPALNLTVAKSWSTDLKRRVKVMDAVHGDGEPDRTVLSVTDQKITIGYFSNNFRNHPMAHLLCRIFGLHDRTRYNIHCYSFGNDDGSVFRQRIKADSDRFVELAHVGDHAAASIINRDKVDILVDLTGFLQGHRMGICVRRPAPVQVRYLGQAGSTGADFFDYLIADPIVIPQSQQVHYTEKLVYLPRSYQINNRWQAIADLEGDRHDFGLPAQGFVFCAFSSHYKLDPVMFATWMEILSDTEGSVLWLIPGSDLAQQNLRRQAERLGVDPDRILFAGRMSKEQHLARLRLADLALDSRIVGGAATTSDALWAGVPVITIRGRHFASRMSASLLNAAGLPELVCHSLEDYAALAKSLAADAHRHAVVKQKLSDNTMTTELFDTEQGVRCLEAAYLQMWGDYCQGRRPRPFTVSEEMNGVARTPTRQGVR